MIQLINNIILIYCFWLILWYIYLIIFRLVLKFDFFQFVLIQLPRWMKCYGLPISTNRNVTCEDGDIDVYSIVHLLMYLSLGLLVPNKYVLFLIISFVFEFCEYLFGVRGRWWQDPLVNMTGYIIGSYFTDNKHVEKIKEPILKKFNKINIIYSIGTLLLYLGLITHCFLITRK